MKIKKLITLIATLGLVVCMNSKVNAVMFYDTVGTRYEGPAERLGELGIINGVSAKNFDAEKTITRAEFAKMIVETMWSEDEIDALTLENQDYKFKDVEKNAWYYKYVMVAANCGYIKGYEDSTFKPNKEVTYAEASKIFMKILGHGYLVETDPRGWAAEYMDKMYEYKIHEGTTYFREGDSATRGNIAIMLWNCLTETVWDKIWLNDTTGFTYVDSGKTLFNKKIKGYSYIDNKKIDGFAEINNELYIKIGGEYYKFHDQDTSVLFSMLGGAADALLRYVRYPLDEYRYEIIGLSTDMGARLYSGTYDELKADDLDLNQKTYKVGTNTDYAYYIQGTGENDDRVVSLSTNKKHFYVENIKIDSKTEDSEKDEENVAAKIENDKNKEYIYIKEYKPVTKTVTINEDYVIGDSAVLFKNNKRVNWKTLKAGDVLTEIEKDKYYFVSSNVVDAILEGYKKDDNKIIFNTKAGEYISYSDTTWLRYYDGYTTKLNKIKTAELDRLKGKAVKLTLDFAGKVIRIEITQSDEKNDILEADIGYLTGYYFIEKDGKEKCVVKVTTAKKKKTFTIDSKNLEINTGELVKIESDEEGNVKNFSVISKSAKINERLSIKQETQESLLEKIEKNQYAVDVPVLRSKYFYKFGEYEDVKDVEVINITLKEIENYNPEKTEYYTLVDLDGIIRTIFIKDFSEKKDLFYGQVMKIYNETGKNKLLMLVDVLGNSDMEFQISGKLNCEEGDFISFKMPEKNTISVEEKFSTDVLGYYKDIIIKKITIQKIVTAENGTVDLKKGVIEADGKKYNMNDYTIILLRVAYEEIDEDIYDWVIHKATQHTLNNIDLREKDRIAINEIENTIIIYRGYIE